MRNPKKTRYSHSLLLPTSVQFIGKARCAHQSFIMQGRELREAARDGNEQGVRDLLQSKAPVNEESSVSSTLFLLQDLFVSMDTLLSSLLARGVMQEW